MKSFVEYPLDFEKMLFPEKANKGFSGKLIAHYELYRKVCHLEGSVVKCGIAAEEGFTRFAALRSLLQFRSDQALVAFERFSKNVYVDQDFDHQRSTPSDLKRPAIDLARIQQKLLLKGITGKIEFVPGNIGESIPEYLMENPEMKIIYLNIDFDDYENALTSLQFFYPRLVHGGIVVFDNYYKNQEDYCAVRDYFKYSSNRIYNFSVNKGPHYMVRM